MGLARAAPVPALQARPQWYSRNEGEMIYFRQFFL